MSKEDLISIGILVLIVVIVVVVRFITQTAINKGADAIHNARIKSKEERNSPKQESLADKYEGHYK